jgi:hypothetical protein
MALLRRRTGEFLVRASLAWAMLTRAFAVVAMWGRPQTRLPYDE